MPKATTPSFITEISLKTSSWEESVLGKRFWAAKQQYNALLGECLRRLCEEIYKQKREKTEANPLFKALEKEYGYSEYSLHGYTKQWNKKESPLRIKAALSTLSPERLGFGARVPNGQARYAALQRLWENVSIG